MLIWKVCSAKRAKPSGSRNPLSCVRVQAAFRLGRHSCPTTAARIVAHTLIVPLRGSLTRHNCLLRAWTTVTRPRWTHADGCCGLHISISQCRSLTSRTRRGLCSGPELASGRTRPGARRVSCRAQPNARLWGSRGTRGASRRERRGSRERDRRTCLRHALHPPQTRAVPAVPGVLRPSARASRGGASGTNHRAASVARTTAPHRSQEGTGTRASAPHCAQESYPSCCECPTSQATRHREAGAARISVSVPVPVHQSSAPA